LLDTEGILEDEANSTAANGTNGTDDANSTVTVKWNNKTAVAGNDYDPNVVMSEIEILDARFRCYKDMLLIQKDREYC
jgi:hypothetical protein